MTLFLNHRKTMNHSMSYISIKKVCTGSFVCFQQLSFLATKQLINSYQQQSQSNLTVNMAFSHIPIKQHTAQQRAAQHSNIRARFHPVARRSILRTVGHEPAEQHPNNRVEFSKQLRTHVFDKEEVARQRSHTFRGECAKLPICKLQMPSILDQVHENHRLTTVKSSAKNSSLMCLTKRTQ